MRALLFICLFLTGLCACSRNDREDHEYYLTTADGIATDAVTGKVLNTKVYLSVNKKGNPGDTRLELVDSGMTGDNGSFKFHFLSSPGALYYISPSSTDYFPLPEGGALTSGGQNTDLNVKFIPKGYVRYIIRKAGNKTSSIDYIQLPNSDMQILSDTTVIAYVMGGRENDLMYSVKYKSEPVARTMNATIIVAPRDTVDYAINY
jgi:hypothetical protein